MYRRVKTISPLWQPGWSQWDISTPAQQLEKEMRFYTGLGGNSPDTRRVQRERRVGNGTERVWGCESAQAWEPSTGHAAGKTQQTDKETPSHVAHIKAQIKTAGRAAKPCQKAGPKLGLPLPQEHCSPEGLAEQYPVMAMPQGTGSCTPAHGDPLVEKLSEEPPRTKPRHKSGEASACRQLVQLQPLRS